MNLRSCLAAAALLALAAGCGSSSSSKAAAGSAAATHSAAASAVASAMASASPGAVASVSAPAPSATAAAPTSTAPTSVPGGSTADFCKVIATTEGILTTAATAPQDPTLPQMLKRLHALAATAPAAIRSDLTAIADFDQNIVDAFASGKPPAIKETPELKAAMLHEALWVQKNCS